MFGSAKAGRRSLPRWDGGGGELVGGGEELAVGDGTLRLEPLLQVADM